VTALASWADDPVLTTLEDAVKTAQTVGAVTNGWDIFTFTDPDTGEVDSLGTEELARLGAEFAQRRTPCGVCIAGAAIYTAVRDGIDMVDVDTLSDPLDEDGYLVINHASGNGRAIRDKYAEDAGLTSDQRFSFGVLTTAITRWGTPYVVDVLKAMVSDRQRQLAEAGVPETAVPEAV
jgi:hypothetical protein